jgi:hypothetical protein
MSDFEAITITSDDPKEVPYAIGVASAKAMRDDVLVYVISDGYMLSYGLSYPDGNYEIVAKCYPGGRIEARRMR